MIEIGDSKTKYVFNGNNFIHTIYNGYDRVVGFDNTTSFNSSHLSDFNYSQAKSSISLARIMISVDKSFGSGDKGSATSKNLCSSITGFFDIVEDAGSIGLDDFGISFYSLNDNVERLKINRDRLYIDGVDNGAIPGFSLINGANISISFDYYSKKWNITIGDSYTKSIDVDYSLPLYVVIRVYEKRSGSKYTEAEFYITSISLNKDYSTM